MLQVARRNYFADISLHPANILIGQLQPRSGGRLQVDHELTGIRARKKRNAQQRVEREAEDKDRLGCPAP